MECMQKNTVNKQRWMKRNSGGRYKIFKYQYISVLQLTHPHFQIIVSDAVNWISPARFPLSFSPHNMPELNSNNLFSLTSLISSVFILHCWLATFFTFFTRLFFLQSTVCFYFPLFCYMTLTRPRAGKRKCPRIRHNFGWLVYSNNVSSCNWKQACVAAFVNPKRSLDRFDFAGIHNKSESATIRKLGIIIVKRK